MENKFNCSCGVPYEVHGSSCDWWNAGVAILPDEKTMPTTLSGDERMRRYYLSLQFKAESLTTEIAELRKQLREAVMRCKLAMPENEQDEKWFNEGVTVDKSGDFMERLFNALELGKI